MSEIVWLYLLTRLDNIGFFCLVVLVLGFFVQWYGLSCLFGNDPYEWATEEYKRRASNEQAKGKAILKRAWWMLIPSVILVALPSEKEAMFIVGATGVIEAAKTDTAQRFASKSVKVVEQYLDELLKEEKK